MILRENISKYLRPKPDEEIQKHIDKLEPIRIIRIGLANNIEKIILIGLSKIDKLSEVEKLNIFYESINNNYLKVLQKIFDNPEIQSIKYTNIKKRALYLGILRDKPDILKLILTYPELDPSTEENMILSFAINYDNNKMVKILLNDPRIIAKLEPLQLKKLKDKYNILVKESLSMFKPKTDKEIKKDLGDKFGGLDYEAVKLLFNSGYTYNQSDAADVIWFIKKIPFGPVMYISTNEYTDYDWIKERIKHNDGIMMDAGWDDDEVYHIDK